MTTGSIARPRAAVAAAVLAAGAVATAGSGASSSPPADTIPQVDAAIGVSFYDNKVIPLYVEMEEGIIEAAEEAGIDARFSYANFDPAAQVDQIEQFITQGVDLILASPLDPNTAITAYESASDAGIPILSFANAVGEEYEAHFLGRDWAPIGAEMMEAAIASIDGEGSVALIAGPPDTEVVRAVSTGWQQVLDEHPEITVVGEYTNPQMSTELGLELANTLLASNPDVDAIVCTIDRICLGAAQAVDEQGVADDDIFLASLDADAESVEQVREGTGIDWTVSMRGHTWGRQVLAVAAAFLTGNPPDEHVVPNAYTVVDAASIETLTEDDLR